MDALKRPDPPATHLMQERSPCVPSPQCRCGPVRVTETDARTGATITHYVHNGKGPPWGILITATATVFLLFMLLVLFTGNR